MQQNVNQMQQIIIQNINQIMQKKRNKFQKNMNQF